MLLVWRQALQPCSARVGGAERQTQSRWIARRLQADLRREQGRIQQLQPAAQLNRQWWQRVVVDRLQIAVPDRRGGATARSVQGWYRPSVGVPVALDFDPEKWCVA